MLLAGTAFVRKCKHTRARQQVGCFARVKLDSAFKLPGHLLLHGTMAVDEERSFVSEIESAAFVERSNCIGCLGNAELSRCAKNRDTSDHLKTYLLEAQ